MTVIAGNWKMHHGVAKTQAFFDALSLDDVADDVEILVFPSAVSLRVAAVAAAGRARVHVGIQNIHWEDKGAFTGEHSGPMAAEAGASHVLIGHSERRHVFGESNEDTDRKVVAARRNDLVPVLCVGETLDERKAGRVDEVILAQLDAALDSLRSGGEPFMIAYEPVWAIGTGETATPADASAAHGTLRARLTDVLGRSEAASVPLLYGGSVKPGNAAELLAADDVDGVLVGGASLEPASFAAIAAAAPRSPR